MAKNEKVTHSCTLCWDCENATSGKCPWASDGTPVNGWIAQSDTVFCHGKDGNGNKYRREISSYSIYECPLFKRDAWRGGQFEHESNRHSVSSFLSVNDSIKELAANIITQAIEDWKALDYGRFNTSPNLKCANASELRRFFQSKYFEDLLAVSIDVPPDLVREKLKIYESDL